MRGSDKLSASLRSAKSGCALHKAHVAISAAPRSKAQSRTAISDLALIGRIATRQASLHRYASSCLPNAAKGTRKEPCRFWACDVAPRLAKRTVPLRTPATQKRRHGANLRRWALPGLCGSYSSRCSTCAAASS